MRLALIHWKGLWLTSLLILSITTHASIAKQMEASFRILIVGDSLSSAYGIPIKQGWVALWQKRLDAINKNYDIVNVSLPGQTTAQASAQIAKWLKQYHPHAVIIALGGNDALQGKPASWVQGNLGLIIQACQAKRAHVALIVVPVLPNYGSRFVQSYEHMYATVAKRYDILFEPNMLKPIAQDLASFQTDGIHPTAQVQIKIIDHLSPLLKALIAQLH